MDYISQHGGFGDLWNVPHACLTIDALAPSQYIWEILLQQCPSSNYHFYIVFKQNSLQDDCTIQKMSKNKLHFLTFLDPESNIKQKIAMADFVTLHTWKSFTTKYFQDGFVLSSMYRTSLALTFWSLNLAF